MAGTRIDRYENSTRPSRTQNAGGRMQGAGCQPQITQAQGQKLWSACMPPHMHDRNKRRTIRDNTEQCLPRRPLIRTSEQTPTWPTWPASHHMGAHEVHVTDKTLIIRRISDLGARSSAGSSQLRADRRAALWWKLLSELFNFWVQVWNAVCILRAF
jgi:hypothetical protein